MINVTDFFKTQTQEVNAMDFAPKKEQVQVAGSLFEQVQMEKIFPDCKTWVDVQPIPGVDLQTIQEQYLTEKAAGTLDLKAFVQQYFVIPNTNTPVNLPPTQDMWTHIHNLWDVLSRPSDDMTQTNTTLIPLPHPYVVPGGRFREIYYWDSYFTSIGMAIDGRFDLIEDMLKNFKYLIKTLGFIPNGNRIYYDTRSQPPVFSCMLDLFVEHRNHDVAVIQEYLPALEAEYAFWMHGQDKLSAANTAVEHVVRMPSGAILNRYFDPDNSPRPESYREDIELFAHAKEFNQKDFYQHIRAACESGWDFSSRWMADQQTLASIETLNIIPVDLNMWLYLLEQRIASYHQVLRNMTQARHFEYLAQQRKAAVNTYCWSSEDGYYFDYNLRTRKLSPVFSLSSCAPMFAKMTSQDQGEKIAKVLEHTFLKAGGLVTTTYTTSQQWDSPNGWAPLHWLAVRGLLNYGQHALAKTIMLRWLKTNEDIFNATGKMMEKYNVCDTSVLAQGGEYPSQDGFGWTNAIALKFRELL